ncbi:uncharacterized protein SPSK_10111 [Sporothrix schenckii 1099-18]|uniref:Uncharacterized protein n=1 Tax=Sporothrix schenckii 1099-18 TaxID=1397361 RepID=A0A0F2MBH2_SPOSC|nr:uncharacterized protein SPSK_10111 [Sporothrix schenckii 1099-18]KJR85506.1 hypothetical protein SPSK_10111 [Sporothrix schenckii 1099-18]
MSNSSNSEPKFSTQVEDPSKVRKSAAPADRFRCLILSAPANQRQPDAPKHQHGLFEAAKDKFSAHQGNPGPVLLNSASGVPQEGTKEERRAKAEALNKDN